MRVTISVSEIKRIAKLLKSEYIDIFVNNNEADIRLTKDNITIVKLIKCDNSINGEKRIFTKVIDCIEGEKFIITDDYIKSGRLKINLDFESGVEERIKFNLDNNVFVIDNSELQKGLECNHCISKDGVREVLQNIYVNENEFVAIDGYRMAIRKVNEKAKQEFYIHLNLVKLLRKFKKYVGAVKFYLDDEKTIVKIDDIYIIEKQENDKKRNFVDYKKLIPVKNSSSVTFNKYEIEELKYILKTNIKVISGYGEEILKLKFTKLKPDKGIDSLDLEFLNNKIEKTLTCTINNIKKNLVMGIRPKFLFEALNKLDGDITLKIENSISPILIDQGDKMEMILPIRIG